MKSLILSALFLSILSAEAAGPTYLFKCTVGDGYPKKVASILVPEASVPSSIAEIYIMRLDGPGADPVSLEHATNAQVQLRWKRVLQNDGRILPVIVGADIGLGRSGSISMETLKNYDATRTAAGRVQANTMAMSYPSAIDAVCEWGVREPKAMRRR